MGFLCRIPMPGAILPAAFYPDHRPGIKGQRQGLWGFPDRRFAIWLRVRLGGEPMTTVATDYGYRDGSGVHRVIERLEAKAKSDRALDRQLKRFVRETSSVRS